MAVTADSESLAAALSVLARVHAAEGDAEGARPIVSAGRGDDGQLPDER